MNQMKTKSNLICFSLALYAATTFVGLAQAVNQDTPVITLLGARIGQDVKKISVTPTSGEVNAERSTDPASAGLLVKVQPGKEEYPGIHIKPEEGTWDLSTKGHVTARIVNNGTKPLNCNLRLDGQTATGEWGSNTETAYVQPGATGNAKVYFGHTYGNKPGAKINPAAIVKVVLFVTKSDVEQSFRIESIEASGPSGELPPVKPENVRIKPENGVILGAGAVIPIEQIEPNNGALVSLVDNAINIEFPESSQPKWVSLKPKIGRWDLREGFGVAVTFKNIGSTPASIKAKVNSNGGPTDTFTTPTTIAPGKVGEIEVLFAAKVPWLGVKDLDKTSWEGQKGTGTKFTSDTVSSITLSTEGGQGAQTILVTSIKTGKMSPLPIPDWVGKRPPVDGDWVQTFEENFDADKINLSIWNVYTENYWDKRSHFSITNVIVANGVATLRYEKKTGHHNDDPTRHQTDYATGFLDTYGKWVQRYGYYEARMKLPTAPGLWPAFWVMPDRGEAAGEQWKRADTGNGGMEFDVMEPLTRWGLYRYNVAFHWDGYGKDHKQTGTQNIYYQPDAEGFLTSGLLWLPGLAVIYANGQEIARLETPRISIIQSDIMFTHVSGGWDNNAIDDTLLPDDFVIDYVRVWQRRDLASDVDSAPYGVSSDRP